MNSDVQQEFSECAPLPRQGRELVGEHHDHQDDEGLAAECLARATPVSVRAEQIPAAGLREAGPAGEVVGDPVVRYRSEYGGHGHDEGEVDGPCGDSPLRRSQVGRVLGQRVHLFAVPAVRAARARLSDALSCPSQIPRRGERTPSAEQPTWTLESRVEETFRNPARTVSARRTPAGRSPGGRLRRLPDAAGPGGAAPGARPPPARALRSRRLTQYRFPPAAHPRQIPILPMHGFDGPHCAAPDRLYAPVPGIQTVCEPEHTSRRRCPAGRVLDR